MSSDVQSNVEFLRLNSNAAIVLVTAIAYDYLLVFSREIEYIWCRPWTSASTLFVLIRYVGLCYIVTYGFLNSAFSSGSVTVSFAVDQVSQWSYELFLAAADLLMVLRVYAMWNRSRIILGVLLFFYVPQVITSFVFSGIFNGSHTINSVSVVQILNSSYCLFSYNLQSPMWLYMIPSYALSVALLILGVTQAVKQSFNMYKATKKWQPNRYIRLFVTEGVIYVLIRVLQNVVNLLNEALPPLNIPMVFFTADVTIPLFCMLPRFIVGMREMYDRQCIDTGFGLLSQPILPESMVVSAIAFADVTPEEGQVEDKDKDGDDSEAIRLDEVGEGAPKV